MVLNMKRAVMDLGHRGILSMDDAVGTRIDCVRGRIWVTELRGMNDVVLEAGDSYEISRRDVVVQALPEALVGLGAPAPQRGTGLAARFKRFCKFSGRGGSISCGARFSHLCQRATSFVSEILSARRPADLPTE